MKAIIPVAGMGTRLKPHTHTLPKVLIQVAGKPMLAHILDELKAVGIHDVILVVGYLGEKIINYVKNNYDFHVDVVFQEELLGLGHAIYLAHEFVQPDEASLIVLGDTIFDVALGPVINGNYSSIGVKYVEDPRRFGVVLENNGFIESLVEKPEKPVSHQAIVGIYYLKNSGLLFSCLKELMEKNIRTKGEYQLTDALNLMLQNGEQMTAFPVEGWYDCGKPETLLQTNRDLLARTGTKSPALDNSSIIPPVWIHNSVQIKDSVIGPYVTIAKGVTIDHSIIQNSIISDHASVIRMLLTESLVGDHAVVKGTFHRLNLGDSSELDLD
ncbi:MAG: nucleotidyl transferase [Gemmatimonadetes bacterium]|nr:MAG: nucleotidyl transferase [Gemmatimonadota bacterium]